MFRETFAIGVDEARLTLQRGAMAQAGSHVEMEYAIGEGTGALVLFPLLLGAAAWISQMAKLDDLKLT